MEYSDSKSNSCLILNPLPHNPNQRKKAFECIVEKEENTGNQSFLLFSRPKIKFQFSSQIYFVACKCLHLSLIQSEISLLGKEVK